MTKHIDFRVTVETEGGVSGTSRPTTPFESELDVSPGVRLARFAGAKFVEFIGRRAPCGPNGNKGQVYRIRVDRLARSAAVWRDDDILFTIRGGTVGPSTLENIALAALRKHLMRSRSRHGRGKRGKV